MKGSELPDEWVVRGNHHDAWVNGAQDPISGQAAMLEEARALGALVKTGWKPKRTIVYCAWDGEEPGLVGSTEWVEAHEKELQAKAVAYINSDDSGRGFLGVGGSQALQRFVGEVAGEVIDPQTKVPVSERLKAAHATAATSALAARAAMAGPAVKLEALGSGSDFSPFLQHLGVPSLDVAYSGEDAAGDYHSIYDSYDLYIRFKDPGFYYGAVLAKTCGRLVLRLADAPLLPFDFTALYENVHTYCEELQTLVKDRREKAILRNELLEKKYYDLSRDSSHPLLAPLPAKEVPYMDFSPLQNAVAALDKAVGHAQAAWVRADSAGHTPDAFNKKLYQAEQQLLLTGGLPKRAWYRHALYAPGMYTGYGVKTMPAIREAIEHDDYAAANDAIKEMAVTIGRLSAFLDTL